MSGKAIWIEKFERPAGMEIKHIGNHWYLYERLSVYDKVHKRKRKKSGSCLGAIIGVGLSPSRHAAIQQDDDEIENLEYGATALLFSLTSSMCVRLFRFFPECWRKIFAMALLKCKEQSSFMRMDFHCRISFAAQRLGRLSLNPGRITALLRRAGSGRETI